MFAERGFAGARVESIARRAGANKAMISYHFRGKKGLYEAILAETFTALAARLGRVRSGGRRAPEQLRDFIAGFAEVAGERPAFPAMLLREVLSGGEHLTAEVFRHVLSVLAVVRAIVEQGAEEGAFRRVDPLLTHLSLVGAMAFFLATGAFRRRALRELGLPLPPPDVAGFVAHVQELFTRGLAREAAPRRKR